ncbi:MAG: peroxiredoxin [Bdellovibrionaceae bacterium]|nr:peroxiredoxin [Pseudobdellovibrionaceae bacterium]
MAKNKKALVKKPKTVRKKAVNKAAKKPTTKSVRPKSSRTKGKVSSPKLGVGQRIPDFSLPGTQGQFNLRAVGKKVVLFFYPKDNTPGCTLEGQEFNRLLADFTAAGVVVVGVSRDSLKSHEGFCVKQGFQFALLSDEDGRICEMFDVIKPKNMYGKTVMGIERSTFVISPDGVLLAEWRKVKPEGHAAEVLEKIKSL